MSNEHIDTIKAVEHLLTESERKVAHLMAEIPSGTLVSYGDMAEWTRRRLGLRYGARNVANLRRKLYRCIRDMGLDTADTTLHRLASKGDTSATNDSHATREQVKVLRINEKSWGNPSWYRP
jgi:alkylated DNA nucleotide flippase Atl1